VASDGWTDVQDNPLINFTQTNAAGTKFEDAIDTTGEVKDAPCFQQRAAGDAAQQVRQ
jgi:hypothetical protein